MSSNSVQVEIFAAGDGINYPRPGNTVTVHYTGMVCSMRDPEDACVTAVPLVA